MRCGSSDWLFYVGRLMDAMHGLAQAVWVRALYLSGAIWWAKRDLRRSGAIVVFTFHRILDDRAFTQTDSLPFIVVRERTFKRLVRHISANFEPVDINTAEPGLVSDRLRVGFTMDDGWRDNYIHALPILRASEIPATVFLCTGLAGHSTPFWPEHVRRVLRNCLRQKCGRRAETLIEALVESLKYCSAEARDQHVLMLLGQSEQGETLATHSLDTTLDWEQVREMAGYGIRFGSHSHAHPILTSVPLDVAALEITESKRVFEEELGCECDVFAYPNGDWSPEIRDQLAERGFRRAFTTAREAWLPKTDLLAIPRAHIQQEDLVGLTGRFSAAMFEYATIWKIWLAMRRSTKMGSQIAPGRTMMVGRETA